MLPRPLQRTDIIVIYAGPAYGSPAPYLLCLVFAPGKRGIWDEFVYILIELS